MVVMASVAPVSAPLHTAPTTRATTRATTSRAEGTDSLRRKELAAFLRSRRERVTPEQVGLPQYGRRRTPGLRREEVAQLAGVGITWYTWLEQGRDINASPQVLDAVARTLMLDGQERSHLFTLAGSPLAEVEKICHAVPPAARTVLASLPYPSAITNQRRDILGWNDLFDELWGPFGELPLEERNVLWQLFTNPRWRDCQVDWATGAPRLVAQFRGAMAEHMGEPAWSGLVERLTAVSPEFAEMWARHDVEGPEARTKHFLHPRVGTLNLDYTHFWLSPGSGLKLTTYTPADDETIARLETLRKRIASRA